MFILIILKNMLCYAVIAILCILLIVCHFDYEREFFKCIVFALGRLLASMLCFFMMLLVLMLAIMMKSMYVLISVLTRVFGCYDQQMMNCLYIQIRILEWLWLQCQLPLPPSCCDPQPQVTSAVPAAAPAPAPAVAPAPAPAAAQAPAPAAAPAPEPLHFEEN